MQQQGGGRGVGGGGWLSVGGSRAAFKMTAICLCDSREEQSSAASELYITDIILSVQFVGKNKNVLHLNSLLAARDIVL